VTELTPRSFISLVSAVHVVESVNGSPISSTGYVTPEKLEGIVRGKIVRWRECKQRDPAWRRTFDEELLSITKEELCAIDTDRGYRQRCCKKEKNKCDWKD